MFYLLTNFLADSIPFFNIFSSITVRAILAGLTSLLIILILGRGMINLIKSMQLKQIVRDDGPKSHAYKNQTPTMGGLMILITLFISYILWVDLFNLYCFIAMLTILAFGVIGAIDDWKKISEKSSKGLCAKTKYFWQSLVSIIIILYLYYNTNDEYLVLNIPFFNLSVYIGFLFILVGYFTIVGTSNAVNLTDGLDGLAILPTVIVISGLSIYAYASGNFIIANYLSINFIPGTGELAILCGAIVGAGLGFLWYNTYPAEIFMGDVGSLALGAGLGIIAFLIRQELILFIMGFIFVAETLSVIIQVFSYRYFNKRIFKMAPLHHHFELQGVKESKLVVRFWIITLILALIALSSLRLNFGN